MKSILPICIAAAMLACLAACAYYQHPSSHDHPNPTPAPATSSTRGGTLLPGSTYDQGNKVGSQ